VGVCASTFSGAKNDVLANKNSSGALASWIECVVFMEKILSKFDIWSECFVNI
jgi:hypothetical protein